MHFMSSLTINQMTIKSGFEKQSKQGQRSSQLVKTGSGLYFYSIDHLLEISGPSLRWHPALHAGRHLHCRAGFPFARAPVG